MTFVNMERIEKRFNNQTVLRDVSLKMNRGENVSIIGPSGSGKSTFLRCLGQLETIDGGSITVDGTADKIVEKWLGSSADLDKSDAK